MMQKPTLTEAARQLHVCARALYAELRRRGVIGKANIATTRYVRDGSFAIEYRGYIVPNTNIERQYAVTVVNPNGMALLQEIAATLPAAPVQPRRPSQPRQRGNHQQSTRGA